MSNSLTYRDHTFTDRELVRGSFSRAQSLDMRELTVDTAQFILRPTEFFYLFSNEPARLFTRNGFRLKAGERSILSQGVVQNAQIKQYIDGSQVAVWLAKSIERISTTQYRLSATSPLGLLMQRVHYGGIYTGQTVAEVVADLMGSVSYYIASEFTNIALYGWLPIAAARDNLMQVLFAINAALSTDSNGVLRIENIPVRQSATLSRADLYESGAGAENLAPVTKIVLVEHQFVVGAETKKLFEGTTQQGQTITFKDPATNLQATGFSILESNANYAIVSAGTGILTGTPYIDTSREIVRDVSTAATENVIRIEKATLVGLTASYDVANRLREYYRHRDSIKVAVVDKMPKGVVQIYDSYDRQMVEACVAKADLSISTVSKTTISALIGFRPWQTVPFEDVRVVVTESSSVTIPENASGITVVLIGGGSGGYSGGSGYPGDNSQSPEFTVYILGAGGEGGIAGSGGLGGKILRSELSPGTYTVTVGIGGAGGTPNGYSSNAGASGNATTISGNGVSLSSASGESLPNGYTDPITGDTYAKTGTSGVAGAGGGKRSSLNGYASNGESLTVGGTTWRGGYGGGVQELYNDYQQVWWIDYHGGGGGAAYRSVGGNAPTSVQNNNGGSGANAVAPSASTGIGTGGNGGNGGGGGGGAGVAWWEIRPRYITASGGAGGSGSQGGTGSSGGAIFYYRVPVTN